MPGATVALVLGTAAVWALGIPVETVASRFGSVPSGLPAWDIPAFDPGPNPFGPPPILTGGFGPLMTAVAGEVADGFIAHPFNSRESLLRNSLPALEEGPARSGRTRADLEIICAPLTVTADGDEELERVRLAPKKQLAFYGSTPRKNRESGVESRYRSSSPTKGIIP